VAILIYLALLAALWVIHCVRQVQRAKRRSAGLAPATDAYEGNLVIPPPGTGRPGHTRGVFSHLGSGGHSVHHGHGHGGHGHGHIMHGGHDAGMGHMGPGGHH
jgi:hypothetical protein